MIIATVRNQCNRATVIRAISIRVDTLVQVAGKHSAPVPRQMPRKRKSRQTCARDLLNARTCSSRSDLVAASPRAQEISATRIYFGLARLSRLLFAGLFFRCNASAEKRRDGYARKPSSLLLCRGHDAHTRCFPHRAPNLRQPDRSWRSPRCRQHSSMIPRLNGSPLAVTTMQLFSRHVFGSYSPQRSSRLLRFNLSRAISRSSDHW